MRVSIFPVVILTAAVAAGWTPVAYALTAEEAALEAAMPSSNNLQSQKRTIASDPDNLDHYFAYAMLAKKLKNFEESAWALENMLRRDSQLERVKLELGLVYIEMERFDEARGLFQEALAGNPPSGVRENVTKVLAALDQRTKTHHLKVSVLTGLNNDSNANAAPGSGNVTVVDTTIPLGAGAGSKEDLHAFAALSASHSYDIDVSRNRPSWRWKTSSLAYRTEQDTLDNLNIGLYNLKTGPEVTLSDMPLQAGLMFGYQHITLDKQSYLRNPRIEANINLLAQPDLILTYGYTWEYRDYLNSETTTTYHDRSGRALQHTLGARHILSPKDMFAYSLLIRSETARELYYANQQVGFNATYTRALTEKAFASITGGYKSSRYITPDLLISARDRKDDEYSIGTNFGYRFESDYTGDFIVSAGYQYRDIGSTIQNYEYDNHRFSLSLTKEFDY